MVTDWVNSDSTVSSDFFFFHSRITSSVTSFTQKQNKWWYLQRVLRCKHYLFNKTCCNFLLYICFMHKISKNTSQTRSQWPSELQASWSWNHNYYIFLPIDKGILFRPGTRPDNWSNPSLHPFPLPPSPHTHPSRLKHTNKTIKVSHAGSHKHVLPLSTVCIIIRSCQITIIWSSF